MDNFIMLIENAVPDEFCDTLVNTLEKYLEQDAEGNPAYMDGSMSNHGVMNRKDQSFMFEIIEPDLHRELNAFLNDHVQTYCKKYPSFARFVSLSQRTKVQKTSPKGGFHMWHCEQGYGDYSEMRTLVWTVYLNDVPDGEGETEFLELGVKVKPRKGTLCFFPAGWTHTHRGNPVYSTNKYMATGWYYMASE